MLPLTRTIYMVMICYLPFACIAQITSEERVIELTLANYPAMKVADLKVQQQKALEKTSFNPEQPQLIVETPTDFGLGYEVEQEIDFPLVYTRRSKWLKSETRVAEQSALIARNELIRVVRLAYLDAQIARELHRYHTSQDSLWEIIVQRSDRLYEGGEISKADQLFSQKQKGVNDLLLMYARVDWVNKLEILNTYTGLSDIEVEEIRQLFPKDTVQAPFYFEGYLNNSLDAASNEANVWRASRWPGLLVGFTRETEFETDYRYRFKAGITVPIWQGQYTGEINALKKEIEMLNVERDLRMKEAKLEALTWNRKLTQAELAIGSYQLIGKPRIDELNSIYNRLYEGGEMDFIQTLRNIADLSSIYPEHLEIIRLYNQAVIELDFLHGVN